MSQSWVILSIFFLGLTAFCSYIGDDDVVYQFMDRKPTPREAVVRIRWVLLKMATSIYGGFVLAAAVKKSLVGCCSVHLSENPVLLIVFVCMGVVSLLISLLQNQIRRLRGRPTRPLIDRAVWRRNLGQR